MSSYKNNFISPQVKVSQDIETLQKINSRIERITRRGNLTKQQQVRIDTDIQEGAELVEKIKANLSSLSYDNHRNKLEADFNQACQKFETFAVKTTKSSKPMRHQDPSHISSYQNQDTDIPQMANHSIQSDDLTTKLLTADEMDQIDLEDRRKRLAEFQKVEQDVNDLNDMFKEMNELVALQGETLDTIDNNLTVAHDQLESAHEELVEAEEYSRKARRKKCLISFILVLALAGLIIFLAKIL